MLHHPSILLNDIQPYPSYQRLQMLFRGQNILGYAPYADDVVEYFVQKSIANGIDIYLSNTLMYTHLLMYRKVQPEHAPSLCWMP